LRQDRRLDVSGAEVGLGGERAVSGLHG